MIQKNSHKILQFNLCKIEKFQFPAVTLCVFEVLFSDHINAVCMTLEKMP